MDDMFWFEDEQFINFNGPCDSCANLLCPFGSGTADDFLLEGTTQNLHADVCPFNEEYIPARSRFPDPMDDGISLSTAPPFMSGGHEIPTLLPARPETGGASQLSGAGSAVPLGPGLWEMRRQQRKQEEEDDRRHKLAFEIAGTRTAALSGQIEVSAKNTPIARYRLSHGGVYGGHRRQCFINNIEPGNYSLDLRLADNRYGRYTVPLTIGKRTVPTCPNSTDRGQWDTVLVPLVPRTYTTVHLKREDGHCDHPPQHGFIYVYLEGRLWRELQVLENGWFSDVNLAMEKGKDIRDATSRADRTIMTPFMVEGHRTSIEICYAQTQWSWAQIESLGGMADDDHRLQTGPTLKPVTAEKFPLKRLQTVNLSSYPDFDKAGGNVGHCRQKGENVEKRRPDLRSFFDTGLPVVYLHNALGIAESLSAQYYKNLIELRRVVADLPTLKDVEDLDPRAARAMPDQKEAYFRCAVLAYRVFFDPETTRGKQQYEQPAQAQRMSGLAPRKTPFDLGGMSLLRRKTSEAKRPQIFDTCQEELHRKTLEDILQVTKRRQLRNEMRRLKKVLTEFLQDRVYLEDDHPSQPTASIQADFISVNAMLADYANLNGPTYGSLWHKSNGIHGFLNHEPCSEDPDLDIAADISAEKPARPEQDPGYAYLQSILKPSHPLCTMLWPSAKQVDHAREAYNIPSAPEPADGSGRFRKGAFHFIAEGKGVLDRPQDKNIKDLVKINKQITAHMLWALKKQCEGIDGKNTNIAVCTLIRFVKAAGHPDLKGIHIVPKGSKIDLNGNTHVVVGAGTVRFDALAKRAFMKQRPGSSAMNNAPAGVKQIYRQNATALIGKATNAGRAEFTDQAPKMTRHHWKLIWGRAKKSAERIFLARTDLIVTPGKNGYATNYHNKPIDSALSKGLKNSKIALPPVIAGLEMLNFGRASAAAIDSILKMELDIPTAFNPLLASIRMSYYVLDAAVVLIGQESVQKSLGCTGVYLFEKTIRIAGTHVIIYRAVGAGITAVSAITSAWDMMKSLHRDDIDAAVGYGVATTALAGLSLAKLGAAEVTAFAGLIPWAAPMLITGIIGTIYAFMASDSELEKWVKHGPFALSSGDRWTHAYNDATSVKAFKALLGTLLTPMVQISYSRNHLHPDKRGIPVPELEVSFITPGFDPATSKLDVDVSAQRGAHTDGAGATIMKASGDEDYKQHMQPVYRRKAIWDGQSGQVIGTKYFYQGLGVPGEYHWRVRARHIKRHHEISVITPPLLGKTDSHAHDEIDKNAPGWAYADV